MHLILPLLFACGAPLASAAAPPSAPLYQSAFASYKPFDDAKPGNWKQINVDIAKSPGYAGMQGHGHAGHMAAPVAAPAATPVASPVAPSASVPVSKTSVAKPDPHAGHPHH